MQFSRFLPHLTSSGSRLRTSSLCFWLSSADIVAGAFESRQILAIAGQQHGNKIQVLVFGRQTLGIELSGLRFESQADLTPAGTLARRSGITGQSLRLRTKCAVAFLTDTLVSQLGEKVMQETLYFACPLGWSQHDTFAQVAGIFPYGASTGLALHHLVGAEIVVKIWIQRARKLLTLCICQLHN